MSTSNPNQLTIYSNDQPVPSAPNEVGGLSTVVYFGKIYCFYSSHNISDENLYYYLFDGSSGSVGKVTNAKLDNTTNPSAVVYNNKIYCFYKDDTSHNGLWYAVSDDGQNWNNYQVPSTYIYGSPSAVVNGTENKIYCFHQSTTDRETLYYSIFDGSTWGN